MTTQWKRGKPLTKSNWRGGPHTHKQASRTPPLGEHPNSPKNMPLTYLQVKSNGLLEVTVVLSGEHRKRNVPGGAFRKIFLSGARSLLSPALSSPASVASSYRAAKGTPAR